MEGCAKPDWEEPPKWVPQKHDPGAAPAAGAVFFFNVFFFFCVSFGALFVRAARQQYMNAFFFALACSLLLWGDLIGGSEVLYTHNNAVRDVLISCNTSNCIARKILVASLALEYSRQICQWYARVPTDSNLSDGPSRLDPTRVRELGATLDEIDVVDCWAQLSEHSEKWGGRQA